MDPNDMLLLQLSKFHNLNGGAGQIPLPKQQARSPALSTVTRMAQLRQHESLPSSCESELLFLQNLRCKGLEHLILLPYRAKSISLLKNGHENANR